jgi:hypothetical protein
MDIPEHIVKAIRQAWPGGVVDMPIDYEETYFWEVYPALKQDLSRIQGAHLVYEREPEGKPQWDEGSNPDEDPPDWQQPSRSYQVFFLSPADEGFSYETETFEPDDEALERRFPGQGALGCTAVISLLASFAVVKLDQIENYENGASVDPDIEPHVFSVDGGGPDPDSYYIEMVEEQGFKVLQGLRGQIAGILESHGLTVLPDAELHKPVPWLRGGEEACVGVRGAPVTVRDAFFFHHQE